MYGGYYEQSLFVLPKLTAIARSSEGDEDCYYESIPMPLAIHTCGDSELKGLVRRLLNTRKSKTVPLFVYHMPKEILDDDLRSMFLPFGCLHSVKVMVGAGYGFVNFTSHDSAAAALRAMNGRKCGGRRLNIEFKYRVDECIVDLCCPEV